MSNQSTGVRPESFYVMHEVDGDECLLADRPDFAGAFEAAKAEATRDPRAGISIWSTTRGILVLPGRNGGWVKTKATTTQEIRTLRGTAP